MTIVLIDSHAHLDGADFNGDIDLVLSRATEAGVTKTINIGATDGFEGAKRSIALAEKYPKQIWCTVGIHPHDAALALDINQLKTLASHPKVKAIGETGLDFYRDWSPKDLQEKWFKAQVELAKELKLPLIIHSREAGEECLKILIELNAKEVGGVFHCYAEDSEFAKKLADINFLVSFPGTITFPKAENIRKAAIDIPLTQIMLETDAPYMAPVPFRGKRAESAHVRLIAEELAKIKQIDLNEVAKITTENAVRFFGV